MNKKEKIEENSENVKNDKKEDLEKRTTRRLVGDIRTYNTRDQDYARQLLFNLTNIDKNNWTKEQCLQFHKSIIVHYIDDKDDQEMLLAVSGLLDGYKSLMIANKRREKYLKSLPTNHKYAHAQPDSFAKNPEKEKLNYIADKLDEDLNNGKIPLLLQQWIPEPQQSPTSELEIGQKPTVKAHKSNIIKCLRALIDDRRKISFALLAFCIILFFLLYFYQS